MPEMKLQTMIVTEVADDEARVELTIADSPDTEAATEFVRASVIAKPVKLDAALLHEVQLKALQRIRDLVEVHIQRLAESTKNVRGLRR